jgi:proline iminopeptidase
METAILILPGGPGVGYEYLRPELSELGSLARVAFFEQRRGGHFDLFLDEVECVRERLGLVRPILLGHSFGGLLAMRYAMEYQERVAALILVDPDPASRALWARHTEVMGARPASSPMSRYFASGVAPEGFEARFTDISRDATTRESLGDWDFHDRLREIRGPVLIVTGDRSIFPPEAMERLRSGIPGASLAVLPNASHFPQIEAHDEFMRVVGEFLPRVRP